MGKMISVAVLMTTHNREKSLSRALQNLRRSATRANVVATVFLSNSGDQSVGPLGDGVEPQFSVREKRVPKTSFWASGMRLAWEDYRASGISSEFILWLNDDTFLFDEGLEQLLLAADHKNREEIVVGSTQSKLGFFTYGGQVNKDYFRLLHFKPVEPANHTTRKCTTFNGNCVLIPTSIDSKLGGFPRGFSHLRADFYYGLTATQKRISSSVCPGYVALCEPNLSYKKYQDLKGENVRTKLKFLQDPKLGPLREHMRFAIRFGGILGPFYAVAPVVRCLISR